MESPAERASESASPRFADLDDEFADPETARIHMLPVPYDRTSTWKKGADRGPAALLAASEALEWYDIGTHSEVYRHGIATLEPLKEPGPPERMVERVEQRVGSLLEAGRFPVVLGGEHSVSIGAMRAAARATGSAGNEATTDADGLTILQLDAHTDLRSSYEGSAYNHGCVMARAQEIAPIVQAGIRSMDREEMGRLDPDRLFPAERIVRATDRGWIDAVIQQLSGAVYITIDLDVLDPAAMPATGTPEPGGLGWYDVTELLNRVCAARRVVGFDVVELLPIPHGWAYDFLAAKLVYRTLSMIFANRPGE
jgi:agmatinase